MPQYLTYKQHTYYFRQAVPTELRDLIGKREIKKSLGSDYARAVSECKRFAVVADLLIAEARTRLDSIPIDPYSHVGIHRTRYVPLTQVTPELEQEFANLMRASLLETDRATRIAGLSGNTFKEYGEHIEACLKALRQQLARGDVAPMIQPAQVFLYGRGYAPEFSDEDWRRIGYVMTEATVEAYEAMATRHNGGVVKGDAGPILVSQFEVQNAPKAGAPSAQSEVSWQNLYDVWVNECKRPANTQAAFLAAMRLFNQSSGHKPPQSVTREDALSYRDFLIHEKGLAPGTVSNKIGFVGTLFSSGRNSAKYAKYLPNNPFADIKVKQSKRGMAGTRRLPFSDGELQTIFNSTIYKGVCRSGKCYGEARAWIPAIAYLTGMRLEEIATLHVRQFQVDALGNPYIHTEDGKNENSTDRDVPIHPALVSAGLLDYVKSSRGRLFPKVTNSDEVQSKGFSQWYGRYLDTLGITAKSKVFHSFRHLFKDLCRNSGLDDSAIDQICGHEPGTVGGKYGSGRRIDVLADLIARIVPPVPLPPIPVKR